MSGVTNGPITKRYVCYVGVGGLPQAKAEAYIRELRENLDFNLNKDETMWFIWNRDAENTYIEVLP